MQLKLIKPSFNSQSYELAVMPPTEGMNESIPFLAIYGSDSFSESRAPVSVLKSTA